MDSAAAHRKIELQDTADFTYLINNVRRAAAESIAAAFPPVEGAISARDEDDLHTRIEELVNEVCSLLESISPAAIFCLFLHIDEQTQAHRPPIFSLSHDNLPCKILCIA